MPSHLSSFKGLGRKRVFKGRDRIVADQLPMPLGRRSAADWTLASRFDEYNTHRATNRGVAGHHAYHYKNGRYSPTKAIVRAVVPGALVLLGGLQGITLAQRLVAQRLLRYYSRKKIPDPSMETASCVIAAKFGSRVFVLYPGKKKKDRINPGFVIAVYNQVLRSNELVIERGKPRKSDTGREGNWSSLNRASQPAEFNPMRSPYLVRSAKGALVAIEGKGFARGKRKLLDAILHVLGESNPRTKEELRDLVIQRIGDPRFRVNGKPLTTGIIWDHYFTLLQMPGMLELPKS